MDDGDWVMMMIIIIVQRAPGQREESASEGEEAEGFDTPDGGWEEAGATIQRPGDKSVLW